TALDDGRTLMVADHGCAYDLAVTYPNGTGLRVGWDADCEGTAYPVSLEALTEAVLAVPEFDLDTTELTPVGELLDVPTGWVHDPQEAWERSEETWSMTEETYAMAAEAIQDLHPGSTLGSGTPAAFGGGGRGETVLHSYLASGTLPFQYEDHLDGVTRDLPFELRYYLPGGWVPGYSEIGGHGPYLTHCDEGADCNMWDDGDGSTWVFTERTESREASTARPTAGLSASGPAGMAICRSTPTCSATSCAPFRHRSTTRTTCRRSRPAEPPSAPECAAAPTRERVGAAAPCVRSAQDLPVARAEEFGPGLVGRERVGQRVLDAVEHDEQVRARERRDVPVRAVHAVGVEPDRRAGLAGELLDAVLVGEQPQRGLVRRPDLLLGERGLVVVVGRLPHARDERLVRTGHDHQGSVEVVVVGQGQREADRPRPRHAVLGVPRLEVRVPVERVAAE